MHPSDPISSAPLVGTANAKLFALLNIHTVHDLLHHYPTRYDDYRERTRIAEATGGTTVTVEGTITKSNTIRTRAGKPLTRITLTDGSGELEALWFNQAFLAQTLLPGIQVQLSGTIAKDQLLPVMKQPAYEVVKEGGASVHTGKLIPVYPETYGLTSKRIRAVLARLLPTLSDFPDPLPESLRMSHRLLPLHTALMQIHLPTAHEEAEQARNRLAFDELLSLHLNALHKRELWNTRGRGVPLKPLPIEHFSESLPYTLTAAQMRVLEEIGADLKQAIPMNRLLQGDVGAGKTAVAAGAIVAAVNAGHTAILMAPTELLAEQHAKTLTQLLSPHGIEVKLLTGSKKEQHAAPVTVGTHAVLFAEDFPHTGLIVVDEQHRFGVNQRATLLKKTSENYIPHVLSMTATPIPRTLALSVYGDLDISVIDELPPGRKPVTTRVVPPATRDTAEQWVHDQIQKTGAQAFVICPLIEESEKVSTKAAVPEYERLKEKFPDVRIALLHGGLSSKEKQRILTAFAAHEYDILVSTTVIEVGIDIPNASIMLIEGAERFGLASLHQLRGRVGRGERRSYCLLMSETGNPIVINRLRHLASTHNGLQLAEIDLKLRGPGELYGTKQSGLPTLKLADLTDSGMVIQTRKAAEEIVRLVGNNRSALEPFLHTQEESVPN